MDGSEVPKARNRVLIVDDEAEILATLERTLRRLGYDVSTADGGEAGLRLAGELRPQVILLDIRMPVMDGLTLLRLLAAEDSDAAVIVMSGQGDVDDLDAVIDLPQVVDYLRKPWTLSELSSAVGRAAEIHWQRRSALKDEMKTDQP